MKKNKILKFRVTENDILALEMKAQMAGLSVSEYLRKRAFDYEVKENLSPETRKVLVGIGNNLNQLTRHAHTGSLDILTIRAIIETLKNLLQC